MANVLSALANFERDRIAERTNMGLARARAQGKGLGRHPVGCGCGITTTKGMTHNGAVKPIRDGHNQVIGWERPDLRPKQTPSAKAIPIS